MAEGHLEVLQVYKLLQCVREKNKPQIEKMVGTGVPNLINLTEPKEGHSALGLASVANDEDMVQFLMVLGAHPDIQDARGRTPVMLASKLDYHSIMALLAKNHANMNMTDNEGKGECCMRSIKTYAFIVNNNLCMWQMHSKANKTHDPCFSVVVVFCRGAVLLYLSI